MSERWYLPKPKPYHRLGSVSGPFSAMMEGRVVAGSLWDVVFPAAMNRLVYLFTTRFLKSWMVQQHLRVVFLKHWEIVMSPANL